jgi:hypothetical protein
VRAPPLDCADKSVEERHGAARGVRPPEPQLRRDDLPGLAVEHEQRVIHVLVVEAVEGHLLLRPVRRIVGAGGRARRATSTWCTR